MFPILKAISRGLPIINYFGFALNIELSYSLIHLGFCRKRHDCSLFDRQKNANRNYLEIAPTRTATINKTEKKILLFTGEGPELKITVLSKISHTQKGTPFMSSLLRRV